MIQVRTACPDQALCNAGRACAGQCNHPVIPAPRLVSGQWEGVPISHFPELQEQVRRGLADGTLQVQ